jgi:putative restriction endonuclease
MGFTMSSQLDKYLQKFANLKTEENQDLWPASTLFRAPHKPLLLMSIIDLVAHGSLAINFVEPTFELIETFNNYWATITTLPPDCKLAESFLDLEEEGFWRAKPVPGKKITEPVDKLKKLYDNYLGADLAKSLFLLMIKEGSRKKLRETLIKTYFAKDLHDGLINVALINHGAALYSKQLLSGDATARLKTGRGVEVNNKLGQLGFRKAILELYGHRCSICGIKLISPEGKTTVDAIHIIPKEISRDDHPKNGLCLCGTCGWAFVNGFMSIGKKYEVLVSTQARLNGNLPAHLLILPDRIISKPKQKSLWPDHNNLKWHRENIFKK